MTEPAARPPTAAANAPSAPQLSVILPMRNQADHIAAVVEEYRAALDEVGQPYELVLVVNGSRDDTLARGAALAERLANVRVTQSAPGWGRAVKAGLAAARGDLLCYTNSARTKPGDLALILRYGLVNDRVVVKASRKVRDSLLRRLGSVLYNFEVRMLFGLAVWDINGTPKVFHRVHLPALALAEDGDLIDLEFIVACNRHRIPIVEVPTYASRRHGGRSTTNLRSAATMYSRALWLYWRERRRVGERLPAAMAAAHPEHG